MDRRKAGKMEFARWAAAILAISFLFGHVTNTGFATGVFIVAALGVAVWACSRHAS